MKIAQLQENSSSGCLQCNSQENCNNSSLDLGSIQRYSRQLILPEFGPSGQCKLRDASVLIVGCGGLGCPAAIYLAAAGIGTLGLVDYDEVELCNLHRQILHTEARIGLPKSHSIAESVQNLNTKVKCIPYILSLSSHNVLDIVKQYDVVLDCTDNVSTRYLLNDACFFADNPLVSGSALRFEGQLTVFGFNGDGPCYRCLFPKPPPPETVTNCSDGGVLGVVPGTIGLLQALETIKVIAKIGDVCSKRMILFDALTLSFRSVKLRGRQASCALCGDDPSIKSLIDYEQFCGGKATDKDQGLSLIEREKRISVVDLKEMRDVGIPHILIDTRTPIEMEICSLAGAVNIPLRQLDDEGTLRQIKDLVNESGSEKVVCICRRGNDSQKAVLSLQKSLNMFSVVDVIGGLNAWAKKIDPNFPIY